MVGDERREEGRSIETKTVPIGEQSGIPGALPQCTARIRAVSVVIVCATRPSSASDQNRLQITPSAGPLSTLKKSMDTHSNRCLVIYRPPGPAACRHQLAGDRPGLFRGQE